jgi:hypothetical protein
MSTKGNLTRDQAIAQVGEKAVLGVESKNCEPTGRLQTDGDGTVEFSASVACNDAEGSPVVITAYYYPTQEQLDDAGDDLSNVGWVIDGYEVA